MNAHQDIWINPSRRWLVFGVLLAISSLAGTSASAAPNKAKIEISSSANPSVYGQWVTLTATVTADNGTPTGTVTFRHGNNILAVAALNNLGEAMFSTNVFSGTGSSQPITADYSGDNNFKGSSANGYKQQVLPATLTVSGLSAKNKFYDATTNATLDTGNATLVGVVAGDAVTLNVSGAKGSFANKNAGNGKTVVLSGISLGGADAGNYTLALPGVSADIMPDTLTVTADNQSRASGTANPALTASYAGFVNGETLGTSDVTGSPALTTTATTSSPAGAYPIAAAAGNLASVNYSFVFVSGTLTVTGKSAVQNPSLALAQPQAGKGVTLSVSGSANQAYVIEASTDLVHWTSISTNTTDANGLVTFVDSAAKNYPSRFYRGTTAAQ